MDWSRPPAPPDPAPGDGAAPPPPDAPPSASSESPHASEATDAGATAGSAGEGTGRWAGWRARRAGRGRRTWGQRGVITAGCVATVALGFSATSLTYVYDKFERLPRVELSGVLDEEGGGTGEAENFLIVGIDNAANLEADDPARRGRGETNLSDTIMVLRIDPASRQAALLSLPRDLWVPIPGTGSSQRINSTLQRGGPELLIETIGQDFGIPIHHYVEVDFASFRGLVEAVDGVPVFIPYAARDRQTGLYVTDLGCVTLDSEQALAYVRSRHYEQLIDGEWDEDPASDLGRIDRQQDFIQRALSRAIDRGARNPRTLDRLIEVGLDGITVDDELTADDIFRLGNRFRSFEPRDLLTYSVPTVGDTVGEAQVLRLVEDEAEPVLEIFRGTPAADDDEADDGGGGGGEVVAPPADDDEGEATEGTRAVDLPPGSVTLEVLNGSGTSGEASEATRQLAAAGFSVIGTGEMPTFDDDETVVRYPPGQLRGAATVAAWLGSGATLEQSGEASTISVITGADWQGVLDGPREDGDTTATTGEDEDQGDEGDEGATTATSQPSLTTVPPASDGSTPTTLDLSARPC